MVDAVSLSSGPIALQSGQLSAAIRAGVQDSFPILKGSRPINKVEPENLNSATPGLGGKIDVIA